MTTKALILTIAKAGWKIANLLGTALILVGWIIVVFQYGRHWISQPDFLDVSLIVIVCLLLDLCGVVTRVLQQMIKLETENQAERRRLEPQ